MRGHQSIPPGSRYSLVLSLACTQAPYAMGQAAPSAREPSSLLQVARWTCSQKHDVSEPFLVLPGAEDRLLPPPPPPPRGVRLQSPTQHHDQETSPRTAGQNRGRPTVSASGLSPRHFSKHHWCNPADLALRPGVCQPCRASVWTRRHGSASAVGQSSAWQGLQGRICLTDAGGGCADRFWGHTMLLGGAGAI